MIVKLDPVHLAVIGHNLEQLRAALALGNPVDALDREHRSALFYAVGDDEVHVCKELLSHGADPNLQDNNGETPLHFAAREYRIEPARLLLDAGAVVDIQDVHGNTPLWRAVFESRGRGEMIKILLSKGADKTLANKYGVSVESLAHTIGNYDVRQFLQ